MKYLFKPVLMGLAVFMLLSVTGCGQSGSTDNSNASFVAEIREKKAEEKGPETMQPEEPVEQEMSQPEEPMKERETEEPEEQAPTVQQEGADVDSVAGTALVETDMYNLIIPSSWQSLVDIEKRDGEYNDYTLGFYHKAGADAGLGGHLFSICMYPDDSYNNLPAYKYMGRILFRPAEPYEIVALYPTDVQFTDATSSEYNALKGDIESVLESFAPNSEYAFYPPGS